MKKRYSLLLVLAMMTGLGAADACASGYGLFGSGPADGHIDGWTAIEAQPPGSLGYPSRDFQADAEHRGGGFVFDTAVAKDRFFNYRLTPGYDTFRNGDPAGGPTLAPLRGLTVGNAFGFGIVRTGGFRIWLGPEIRLSRQTGVKNDRVMPWNKQQYDLYGAGIGPALGMNFNLPGNVTIALNAGYQYIGYYGQMETTVKDGFTDVDVHERLAYFAIGFLVRTGDDRF